MEISKELQAERPSTLTSGIFVWLLKYGSILLGIIALLVGLGFIMASFGLFDVVAWFTAAEVADVSDVARAQFETIARKAGLIIMLMSPSFFVISWLSTMILARNRYINAVEKEIEEDHRPSQRDVSNTTAADNVNYK